jgi:hypothetical protein
MRCIYFIALVTGLTITHSWAAESANETATNSLGYALLHGTPTLDARYRYEHVDLEGTSRNANASTLRSRLGYTTGLYNNFDARFEWQNIHTLGAEHYNSGSNNRTEFPLIGDQQSNRLNHLYLGYHDTNITRTDIIIGRQTIRLDNQRFVGESDWRQSNQAILTLIKPSCFMRILIRQTAPIKLPVARISGCIIVIRTSLMPRMHSHPYYKQPYIRICWISVMCLHSQVPLTECA